MRMFCIFELRNFFFNIFCKANDLTLNTPLCTLLKQPTCCCEKYKYDNLFMFCKPTFCIFGLFIDRYTRMYMQYASHIILSKSILVCIYPIVEFKKLWNSRLWILFFTTTTFILVFNFFDTVYICTIFIPICKLKQRKQA